MGVLRIATLFTLLSACGPPGGQPTSESQRVTLSGTIQSRAMCTQRECPSHNACCNSCWSWISIVPNSGPYQGQTIHIDGHGCVAHGCGDSRLCPLEDELDITLSQVEIRNDRGRITGTLSQSSYPTFLRPRNTSYPNKGGTQRIIGTIETDVALRAGGRKRVDVRIAITQGQHRGQSIAIAEHGCNNNPHCPFTDGAPFDRMVYIAYSGEGIPSARLTGTPPIRSRMKLQGVIDIEEQCIDISSCELATGYAIYCDIELWLTVKNGPAQGRRALLLGHQCSMDGCGNLNNSCRLKDGKHIERMVDLYCPADVHANCNATIVEHSQHAQ